MEDERMEGMAVDSQREGKGFVHREMQYSARRDAVVVVSDP